MIDAHAHVIEYIKGIGYRGELRALKDGKVRWASGEEAYIIPRELGGCNFTHEMLIKVMDANGVSKAVLLQGSLYGLQNEYAYEAFCKHPGRFAALGAFDPYCCMYLDIMKRWIEVFKFAGLKFEMSVYGGFMGYHPDFNVNGERMRPVWDYIDHNGLVASLDIGTFGTPSFQLDGLIEIAKTHQNSKYVIEHLFCPAADRDGNVKRCLESIAPVSNIYVTTASLPIMCAPEKYPYPSALRYVRAANEILGSERIMWGSDIPITVTKAPYAELIDYIRDNAGLCSNDLENIYAKTARKVYGL